MINKTQLNKLQKLNEKNKKFVDGKNVVGDDDKKNSLAQCMSALNEYLSLNQDLAFDALTDGSEDNKIDALYYSDDENELNELVIVQSKYKNNYGETGTFTEDDIKLLIANCLKFLQGEDFQNTNVKLKSKIERYRELLKDNGNPPVSIKLLFITNGIIHPGHKELKEVLECYEHNIFPIFIDATEFGYSKEIGTGNILANLKNDQDKTDSIFNINDDQYSGKIISCSILELMEFFKNTGEKKLLSSNVRYQLKSSTINKEIQASFINDPLRFCYLNNGITILCNKYSIKPTASPKTIVELENPSIVNGGQTISTLYNLYSSKYDQYKTQFDNASILIRLYKAPSEYLLKIAQATNSQNPISIKDLKANDIGQNIAKEFLSQRGIGLITKVGEEITFYDDTITNEYILQIYASLYSDEPAKAKTSKAATFKKYYDLVFTNDITEEMCKKLYRCYEIGKFIINQDKDKVILQNAIFSLIYSMNKINNNLQNQNIPSDQIQRHFSSSFEQAYSLIDRIIQKKQIELKTKFSMNNLFKNKEIQDLIDLELDE